MKFVLYGKSEIFILTSLLNQYFIHVSPWIELLHRINKLEHCISSYSHSVDIWKVGGWEGKGRKAGFTEQASSSIDLLREGISDRAGGGSSCASLYQRNLFKINVIIFFVLHFSKADLFVKISYMTTVTSDTFRSFFILREWRRRNVMFLVTLFIDWKKIRIPGRRTNWKHWICSFIREKFFIIDYDAKKE